MTNTGGCVKPSDVPLQVFAFLATAIERNRLVKHRVDGRDGGFSPSEVS